MQHSDGHGDGALEAIWIKPSRRGPLSSQPRARLVAGSGLAGDAHQGRKRQVTLLSADAWDEVRRELGSDIDPQLRRANLFLRGLDLAHSQGRILRIGGCRIEIQGEVRPCRRIGQAHPGLRAALAPDWRGGAYGAVLDDAEIAVGDPVGWD